MDIILASGSQRRFELMQRMGLSFTVIPSGADESMPSATAPDEFVRELSARKALYVYASHKESCVVGSDTIVVYNGKIIGKPKDPEDAKHILRTLSGKTHTVYTGVAIAYKGKVFTEVDSTDVTFGDLSEADIESYVSSGDPLDKAGAYGIQSSFCVHIERIVGSYFTVIGLPVHKLHRMLEKCKEI